MVHPFHLKRLWCTERLKTGGEGDDRRWDGWMISPTQWTWVWVNSGSWWWTGRPGVLQSMGWQRARHDWLPELNWLVSKYLCLYLYLYLSISIYPPPPPPKLLQSCPTLCDPTDGSPPGSSVSGILQARILEWVAISFSGGHLMNQQTRIYHCPLGDDLHFLKRFL